MSSHPSVTQSLSRLQALGFNAVRLLISFGSVFGLAPKSQSTACATVAPADYQAYLTNPATPVTGGATIPDLAVCHPSPLRSPSHPPHPLHPPQVSVRCPMACPNLPSLQPTPDAPTSGPSLSHQPHSHFLPPSSPSFSHCPIAPHVAQGLLF